MRFIKHLFLIIFLFTIRICEAQYPDRKHSIGVYQVLTDHNVRLLDDKVFSFDSALSTSTRFAYQRKLSRTVMLNTGISNGFIQNQSIQESFVNKAYVIGADASLLFKFNNGRLLKENPRIAPFLSFGYRTDYVSLLTSKNESPWLFHNQYGAGFNVKLTNRTHLQLQMALDQKLKGDFNTHIQYRFGLTQSLGKCAAEKAPEKPKGKEVSDILASKIHLDSLNEKIENQTKEIEDLELVNASLRVGIDVESPANTEKERMLELRLAKQESEHKAEVIRLKKEIKSGSGYVRIDTVYVVKIVCVDGKNDNSEADRLLREKQELDAKLVRQKEELEEKERLARALEELERLRKLRSGGDEKQKDVPLPADKSYYVITISSPNISTALTWQKKMNHYFSEAKLLPQPNGYYRVGVYAARDKALASDKLARVISLGYSTAWISVE